VIEYGEPGKMFYFIIKGLLIVDIPNPGIKDWQIKRKDYQSLLNWKQNEFEPKVREARKERFEKYK